MEGVLKSPSQFLEFFRQVSSDHNVSLSFDAFATKLSTGIAKQLSKTVMKISQTHDQQKQQGK